MRTPCSPLTPGVGRLENRARSWTSESIRVPDHRRHDQSSSSPMSYHLHLLLFFNLHRVPFSLVLTPPLSLPLCTRTPLSWSPPLVLELSSPSSPPPPAVRPCLRSCDIVNLSRMTPVSSRCACSSSSLVSLSLSCLHRTVAAVHHGRRRAVPCELVSSHG